ncbi:MAG TPA: FAD-dependent oxidoreductase, partial [Pseudobdellovibrionaceae bacterium]|nr:FAD-dependent oxidoreductase [Pseudobdellovibrionaceae bacterium]
PFLTAWQGGPKAEEMSSWSEEEKVEKALRTLAVLTRTPFAVLRKKYRAHFTHDWTADPFSRGAYSYMGLSDRRSPNFQKPFRHNVYVAGEAVQKDSSRGTVHGALSSGAAVARSILKTL